MENLSRHCPITAAPFNVLIDQVNRDYFVIKAGDTMVLKGLKQTGNIARKAIIVLALSITALVAPLLFAIDGAIILGRRIGCKFFKIQNDDFHFLFTSSIFNIFIYKLKSQVSNLLNEPQGAKAAQQHEAIPHPFQNQTRELISVIVNAKETNNEGKNRQLHQDIVTKLRALVEEKQKLSATESHPGALESITIVEKLSEFMYVGTSMMPEITQFMESQLPQEARKELDALHVSALPDWIKKWHTNLGRLNKFNGILEVPRLYDPRLLGDMPTVLFEYPLSDKSIKVIRTPTVVKDERRNSKGFVEKAEIVKEFRGFLDSYRKQKKSHLYVNLMERRGRSEAARTLSIENLEADYPDNLRVISLAKNSDFYFQNNAFKDPIMRYETFKQHFLKEMFDQPIAYRWPTALGNGWQQKCADAIDVVHKRHYNGRTNLNVQERKDFIEIAYTEIIEAAMEQLKPDSCNISCLSCIDRAAAMLSEQFAKKCRKNGQEMSPVQRKHMAAIALAPAILAQNRLMQTDRMERLHTAAKRILA